MPVLKHTSTFGIPDVGINDRSLYFILKYVKRNPKICICVCTEHSAS